MDPIVIYATGFVSFLFLSSLGFLLRPLVSEIPVLFARHFQYPLLLKRRYWMSITRLEFVILALYFGANVTFLFLRRVNLGSSAATLAVINATPLFLGGHTNPFADLAGVPLSTYHIFHHFIGRVVIVEGVLHAVLALKRSRLDRLTTSGYIASGGLALILITSFWFMRRYFFRTFAKVHLALALTTLGATTWHILSQAPKQAKIAVFFSCSLWVFSSIYRCIRLTYYTTGATVIAEENYVEATRVDLRCDRPVSFYPGSYFYIFPSGKLLQYNLFTSFPMTVMWYSSSVATEDIKVFAEDKQKEIKLLRQKLKKHPADWPKRPQVSEKIQELYKEAELLDKFAQPGPHLTFLVSHSSRPLRSLRFKENHRLLLDGPYGQDLGLQNYHTVMLAAQGAGISTVLSFALHLWEKQYDGMIRRVNILWSLDHNCQDEWAHENLSILRAIDPFQVRYPTS
ncbi:hypothetical protein B0T14DRAFT_129392 [Immersiella caudata]|uniref:Ferric oxidoreductase domain-containing protein n=1 Tax=Immersiella caudata TaxID=314043 RepID=A0AA39X4H9_9PEZI|nr:hypothetical protein B0T14DRAFT_129392 [Immersiella caudata]